MTEIRKHYFLEEYCIIASERSKRPSDFKTLEKEAEIYPQKCVFCLGNEDKTPPATAVYKKIGGSLKITKDSEDGKIREKNWVTRCFPNLYPAVSPEAELSLTHHSYLNTVSYQGYGFHEIIVETPEHSKNIPEFNDEEIKLLLTVYKDRVDYYQSKKNIKYVSLFKNQGANAGASLSHMHNQLVAIPIIPPILQRELQVIKKNEKCPYCEISEKESKSERLISENKDFIVIAPFYSQSPFETWILPKEHINHLREFDDKLLESLAFILRDIISRISNVLDKPPYNYMLFQLLDKSYHFNIRIQPVLSIVAGFEKNTGIYINTVEPEQATNYLREVKV